jgi:hypothetical protein
MASARAVCGQPIDVDLPEMAGIDPTETAAGIAMGRFGGFEQMMPLGDVPRYAENEISWSVVGLLVGALIGAESFPFFRNNRFRYRPTIAAVAVGGDPIGQICRLLRPSGERDRCEQGVGKSDVDHGDLQLSGTRNFPSRRDVLRPLHLVKRRRTC